MVGVNGQRRYRRGENDLHVNQQPGALGSRYHGNSRVSERTVHFVGDKSLQTDCSLLILGEKLCRNCPVR